ncbi:MAG: NYN domain-containing protein [Candidatus Omnitrophica bacterium]|nr:NYN domain-containing protein [Candidatus Omnitrophota bacterium]
MITLILDGYNVIHAVPQLSRQLDRGLQPAREALVRLCEAYRARRGDIGHIYVVFDGRDDEFAGASEQPRGRVTLCFTRAPEEADQRILRLIEAERPGRCVVVSNDNEVFNNARAYGARVISAQEFVQQMQPARPVKASRARPRHDPEKPMLSVPDAQRITDEYRRHLEGKTRSRRLRSS